MINSFLDALSAQGIPPTHPLIYDGKLRRYHIAGDKRGRKNGWYIYLALRDDFAVAYYGSHRHQISEKWISKERKELTKYDHNVIKKKNAQLAANELELQARVAVKANELWNRLPEAEKHPYSVRKQITPHNARILNNALVIPVYDENYITSLQFILPDGFKRFLTGGKTKDACYSFIGADSEKIIICEGWATGCSLHEATGQQVIIAFSCNKLVAVAKFVRAGNPHKEIIIVADNDQYTKGNPGVSAAQEAADAIGAKVIVPPFKFDESAKLTDANDWHNVYGLESLFTPAPVPAPLPLTDWRTQLLDGKAELAGYKLFEAKSVQNCYLFLKHHDNFKDTFAYNVFTNEIVNLRTGLPLDNVNCTTILCELERLGLKSTKTAISDNIERIAYESPVNPPRDYFDALEWDGVPRLDTWLTDYLGAVSQPYDYLRAAGSKWLIAAVARIFKPGTDFHNVLTLEGGQGIGKTSVFKILSSFGNENYFLEFSGDVSVKDSLAMMQGKLIVEMSELSSLRKSEVEDMKAFISRPIDEYRPPYSRYTIKRPRMFVLGATTNKNKDDGYLVDDTGNRRHIAVECGDIDLDTLARDKNQLWAEAAYRYKQGESIYFNALEKELAAIQQGDRMEDDTFHDFVSEFLIDKFEVSVAQVGKGIGLTTEQGNNKNSKRIVRALKELGWRNQKIRVRSQPRVNIWQKPVDTPSNF